MRYSFRLAELLGHVPDPKRRPGTVKAIVEQTGLDRHQVAALLKNEVKYIPLAAMSKLAEYLIENGHVSADQLPGALFAIEPENFWELLARRKRLELCLGVRKPVEEEQTDASWVVASDSLLLGELLGGVSTLGGTETPALQQDSPPHPKRLKQSLVWAPGQGTDEEVIHRASEVYSEFSKVNGDKALVCLGSVKSNPACELVLANVFGCEPFSSEDEVSTPNDRSVPFYIRYRMNDPQKPSCAAGLRLSEEKSAPEPGIYYEKANGSWGNCRWEADRRDAALVFYVHRESKGHLEMLLGGFSGRATRMLARILASDASNFWPPIYKGQGLQIGAFVVQLEFTKSLMRNIDLLRPDVADKVKVIPLDESVIARRLAT